MNALCRYCGGHHAGVCPRVKSIEYFQDGSLKLIQFF